jgi:hypothetical protein
MLVKGLMRLLSVPEFVYLRTLQCVQKSRIASYTDTQYSVTYDAEILRKW